MENNNNSNTTVSNPNEKSTKLNIKEQVLRFALENSNIGAWDYDASTQKVIYSKESKNILGFKDHEIGSSAEEWNNRVHPEDKAHYFKEFNDHLNGINPFYESEHRIQCKNGTYKWILDKGRIVSVGENGKPKRVIGTHTDITKIKLAEKKTKEALNLATELNNKLRNFAHIVTHNLKQHAGNFENLIEFYNEAETVNEKDELVKHIETTSNSLTKTIKNLNQVVSVQTNKNKRVEKIFIAQEINNILNNLEFVVLNNNAIINNNVPENIYINYNPIYFESIVQNMLTNAIKYKHPERDPVVNIDLNILEKRMELLISDNGIGIDLEKYGNTIFGLYKTFHNNEDSEGVGLYLIKNQIESFGGKITIASKINTGTTFTVTLTN
ncbi:PAS domain-containing protein [Oceanihabitans sp. 2_MG-2023]|uniref:PAS domain-containing protein n=1 Tax=Oceanihabitans sp. 2_MG-2023 TaxID=3062661 RepID=UPI0026E381E5|nr:PAS domain-containing protein [Oceanihabitans sp. 2_MG-2023]MDO6597524.1 PAS domain-containing protein [Oceanihabitans sp. 2_MG-2023]